MDNKKWLLLMEILLIIILVICILAIQYRTKVFTRDCVVFYEINDVCPCSQVKFNSAPSLFGNINMSVYKQGNVNHQGNNNIST